MLERFSDCFYTLLWHLTPSQLECFLGEGLCRTPSSITPLRFLAPSAAAFVSLPIRHQAIPAGLPY